MSTKRDRHTAILELIDDQPVATQEELRDLLSTRGWDVTQSTLSRDVHELRLARVPTADGVRYVRADARNAAANDERRLAMEALIPQFVLTVDGVGELLVLRTPPGSAHTVAVTMDVETVPDIIGTIAGDDTILVVCRSAEAREKLARQFQGLIKPGR